MVINHKLTPPEVANMLGISVRTLSQWRWKGRGPAYINVGGNVRYDADAIQAWLTSNTTNPAEIREGK